MTTERRFMPVKKPLVGDISVGRMAYSFFAVMVLIGTLYYLMNN
jgi:hypothetical protein